MRSLGFGLLLATALSVGSADDALWLRRLGSHNPRLAQPAVAHFVAQGAPAVPVLRQVLVSGDLLARQYAAAALARLALPGADKALLRALMTSQDDLLRQFCAEALAARGAAVIPLLRHALALDAPPPPDHPFTRADDQSEARRSLVFEVIYDLPPALALPLCAEYVSRPEGNRNDAAKVLFLDQGADGMRLWARSFLSQTGLPDVAAANRAWDAGKDEWDDFMHRWSISHWMHPAPYEIALYDEPDKQADWAMVRQVAEEARQSPSAPQRLWGYYHLAMLTPEEGGMELLRQALSDPCWMVPAVFLDAHRFGVEEEAYETLAPALVRLAGSPCKAIRLTAAQIVTENADPAAPGILAAILRDGSRRDREEVGWSLCEYTSGWSDEQHLQVLEPLLAVNKTIRGETWTCNALETMPATAWPRMAGLLAHPWAGVRQGGAEIAGAIGAKEAVPALVQALEDPAEGVRNAALSSLATLLQEEAAPYIRRVFDRDGDKSRRVAYRAALEAENFALVAEMILAHPELTTPPRSPDSDVEYGIGMPVVRETREGDWRTGKAPETEYTVIPEILAAACRLFADERQPVRVRLTAAEAILKAGLPDEEEMGPGDGGTGGPPGAPPAGGKSGEAPDETPLRVVLCQDSEIPANASLPPELWPALKFALEHYPRGIFWGPNEAEPILRAARLVRDPGAIPTLLDVLRQTRPDAHGGPRDESELTAAVVCSLLQIKPEGEDAFWRFLDASDQPTQLSLLQAARGGCYGTPADSAEKMAAAWLRVLRGAAGPQNLPYDLATIFPPGTPAAAEARQALRDAYAQWTPGGPSRTGCLRALAALKDPDVDALYLQLLVRRDMGPDRRVALWSLKRLQSPAAFRMAVTIANSEFENYWDRYSALRAVEKRDPPLAREIAARWTHDRRYKLRQVGRLLLAGEEQMYL